MCDKEPEASLGLTASLRARPRWTAAVRFSVAINTEIRTMLRFRVADNSAASTHRRHARHR